MTQENDLLPCPELMEVLADIEHERWSGWMRYFYENNTPENNERWKKQMVTPYKDLPEHSKESDRKEVRKTLEAINEYNNRAISSAPCDEFDMNGFVDENIHLFKDAAKFKIIYEEITNRAALQLTKTPENVSKDDLTNTDVSEALEAFKFLLAYPALVDYVGTLTYDPAVKALAELRAALVEGRASTVSSSTCDEQLQAKAVDVEGLKVDFIAGEQGDGTKR